MPVSLNSTLSTARSALTANQAAMQVVSDNIANATTEGYTRKRAVLGTGPAQVLPEGVFGTGVVVRDVAQQRDRFLDAAYRDASSSRQQQQVRYEYLEQIEAAFGEPDSGLANTLDAFWNSWSDLANDPLNQSARGVIRERGVQLVAQVKRLSSSLDRISESAQRRLGAELQQINTLTERIANLNGQIVAAEAGGITAGQLRDERDLSIDQLAGMTSIQVMERRNGTVAIALDGLTLVDGDGSQALRTTPQPDGGNPPRFHVETMGGTRLDPAGGSLAAYLKVVNDDVRLARTDLNTIVNAVVTSVNDIHRGVNDPTTGTQDATYPGGVNPNGTKVAFFTVDPLDAANTVRLSDQVQASAANIAAGTGTWDAAANAGAGAWVYRSGTNDVANQLAALRTAQGIIGDYTNLVARIGMDTNAAADNARAQAVLAGQAANRRDSLMGVSTDEEMVDLIKLQKAYAAAARVVTTADEMMQTLLDLKR